MNILPKKRWHVRTRENIARVRRDEAAAAEEEKKKDEKIKLAEKEARRELLRVQAREKYGFIPKKEESTSTNSAIKPDVPLIDDHGHVNLFYELEQNEVVSNKTNADHEKEAKDEREKEEMKIGYLTYLGQDTNELTGNVSWYNRAPQRAKPDEAEIGMREKLRADPLKDIRQYLESEGVRNITESVATQPSSSKEKLCTKKRKNKKKIEKLAKKLKKRRKERKRKKKNKRKHSSSSSESEDRDQKKTKKGRLKKSPESEDRQKQEEKERELERLRTERLRREQVERQKAAELLARVRGEPTEHHKQESPAVEQPPIRQKYNSQFNPLLARQNLEN